MTDLADGLCNGKWELFDSDDADDHAEAKALCMRCPCLDWCRQQLDQAMADTLYPGWGPSGTWAGIYIGRRGSRVGARPKRREAQCGTPSGYSKHKRLGTPYCEACREAKRREAAAYKARREAS